MELSRCRLVEGEAIPRSLQALSPPCRGLHVLGVLPADPLPRVAVVGSRTPSASGRHVAYELGRELGRAGVVVVSGMARGIDAAAHRGALDGGGTTVAFLGCGIDVVYPASSREIAERIPEQGALVSEYPSGTPPLPYQFVHRNRLVAAYTLGTVVVEGGSKSGALITAGMALEMGREVWALPGDPRRPSCRGSNRLLRDGAGVILDAGDLIAALGLRQAGQGKDGQGNDGVSRPPGLSAGEEKVWDALATQGPGDPESLSRRTGLTAAALLEALSILELAGHIERDDEGYVLVRHPSLPSLSSRSK